MYILFIVVGPLKCKLTIFVCPFCSPCTIKDWLSCFFYLGFKFVCDFYAN